MKKHFAAFALGCSLGGLALLGLAIVALLWQAHHGPIVPKDCIGPGKAFQEKCR